MLVSNCKAEDVLAGGVCLSLSLSLSVIISFLLATYVAQRTDVADLAYFVFFFVTSLLYGMLKGLCTAKGTSTCSSPHN